MKRYIWISCACLMNGGCAPTISPESPAYSARQLIDVALSGNSTDVGGEGVRYRDLPEGWAWIDGLVGRVTERRLELFACDQANLSEWAPSIVVNLRRSAENSVAVERIKSVDATKPKWIRLYGKIYNSDDPGNVKEVFGSGDGMYYVGPVLDGVIKEVELNGCSDDR